MITVYKKKYIPKDMKPVIINNDIFFNKITVMKLDDKAEKIINEIDHSEMLSNYQIRSKFDGSVLNIDRLSTGCKTALNILYNTDRVFDICECGDNALDVIYALPRGNIYCAHPFISFDMERVDVYDKKGLREVVSYEELKAWWTNEN